MLISEIYQSRQGEGLLTGTPSVFLRTSGCNLRCGFCDTPFASWEPTGEQMSIEEIRQAVSIAASKPIEFETAGATNAESESAEAATKFEPTKHLVLTGGEPMLPREVIELCQAIKEDGFHITIETAGTIYHDLPCDLMSISPKLSNSDPSQSRAGEWLPKHQSNRSRPDITLHLMETYNHQLKFVVDSPKDVDEILEYVDLVKPKDLSRVLLMPQGISTSELDKREKWLAPLAEEHGFTFCARMHIKWYGNKRGT